MRKTLCLLILILCHSAFAQTKRCRVELILFQQVSRPSLDLLEWGTPDLTNALPFVALPPEKLVLVPAKQKFSRRYAPILHQAWIQTLGSTDTPTKTHLFGGKKLANDTYEVNGTIQIYPGRQMFIMSDLALYQTDRLQQIPVQVARFQSTFPIVYDELNYVEQSHYAMLIFISPEVKQRVPN